MYDDTIAAISTPLGASGIGIARMTGPDALAIARRLFTRRLRPGRLSYGHIVDPESREIVDEALASYMPAPHSYTREDVVEVNCHGGALPLQGVLALMLRHGARAALPGEFTLRAFLNGRIDLAQAEAVADVVEARTAAALRLAVDGLRGRLSTPVRALRARLVDLLAYLTARVDFPEDDVPRQDIAATINECSQQVRDLLANADAGLVFRQGVRTAIVGRPNVGKSSLLNRLLRENRAIVTPVPGTTRDTVEEVVNLHGVPFVLVDTAGIVESRDPVESLGVERSRRAIARSELVLFVVDASQELAPEDEAIARLLDERSVLLAANKCDLSRRARLAALPWEPVTISALTGQGLDELELRMVRAALGGEAVASDQVLVTNPRHKDALERTARALQGGEEAAAGDAPEDLIAVDISAAAEALGEITGETVGPELLEAIFSRFCIGK